MMRNVLTAILFVVAGSAVAGDFTPPNGCTAYLTVQASNCQVEHHWTCEADPVGDKWHAEIGQNGPVYIGRIDAEAQWIDSYDIFSDTRDQLIQPATDPASLTELLANGLDTYDFSLNTPKGRHDVKGYDRIAQRDVIIDGEVLHQTEYAIRITNAQGEVTYASEGSEFVSETHRRFFSGFGTVSEPSPPFKFQAKPVQFIYPGEKGYLDNTPKFGCDVLSARAVFQ